MRHEHLVFAVVLPVCLFLFAVATAAVAAERADRPLPALIRRAAQEWYPGSGTVLAVILACVSQVVPVLALTYPLAKTPEGSLAAAGELAAAAAWVAYLVAATHHSN
jgi:hypothetical protein